MPSILHTQRLVIRDITDDDLPFIHKGLSDPDVIKYYGVSYNTLEEAKSQMAWYKEIESSNTGKWWLIVAANSAIAMGAIGFNYYQKQHNRIELGFWLLPEYQGSGIMLEALTVLIPDFVAKWNIHRVEALVETENTASKKLLMKAGFLCDGLLRDYEQKDGRYISLEVFSKLF